MLVLDTSIAIHLRDGDADAVARLRATEETAAFSIVTLVELEAGLVEPESDVRRARLDTLLETINVRPFDQRDVAAYGQILSVLGFSRRKVLDRMIAAQAIVDDATLVTLNGADFRDIPGLKLLEW